MPCVRVHPFHRFQHRHHPFAMRGGGFPGFMFANALEQHLMSNSDLKHKARVHETEQAFIIRMDVPGVKSHQVGIEEKNGEVEIVAIRMDNSQTNVAHTYQEVLYVDPYKADLENTQAHLDQGVLMIEIPKKVTPEMIQLEPVAEHPPASTSEESDEFRIEADLPGVKPSQLHLKVSTKENILYLRANREVGQSSIMVTRRMFAVPRDADMAAARAYLLDGVFTLVAPKYPELKEGALRVIPVNDIPSLDGLSIHEDEKKEDEEPLVAPNDDSKQDVAESTKTEDEVMVETVPEEKEEWEHVDDSNDNAKN